MSETDEAATIAEMTELIRDLEDTVLDLEEANAALQAQLEDCRAAGRLMAGINLGMMVRYLSGGPEAEEIRELLRGDPANG